MSERLVVRSSKLISSRYCCETIHLLHVFWLQFEGDLLFMLLASNDDTTKFGAETKEKCQRCLFTYGHCLMTFQFNQFIIKFRKLESKLDFLGCSENLRLVMQKKRKKNRKQNYSRVKVATTVHSETC